MENTHPHNESTGHASGPEAQAQEGSALASVTIVIEWDNANFCDVGRPLGMLRALSCQLRELEGRFRSRPEIRLIYDSARTERAFVERLLSQASGGEPWPGDVGLLPVSGMRYYEQKNWGALHAGTEVILFLDSDVIPEPDWLRSLMESFADPSVSVVGGGAYVVPDGLLGKAFALFWFFPLRDESDELAPSESFFANNVAFRREIFEKQPFPDALLYRGQCSLLAARLRELGVRIYRHRRARVSHPRPRGISQFVLRALYEGHDGIVLGASTPNGSAGRVIRSYLERIVRLPQVVLRRRGRVQIGLPSAFACLGIGYAYHALKLLGGVVAWIHPLRFRRWTRLPVPSQSL